MRGLTLRALGAVNPGKDVNCILLVLVGAPSHSAPDFKVLDMLPPDYIAAVRVDRRRSWRSAIDQSVSYFESNQDARLMDAYTLMSSAKVREAFEYVRDCL